MTPKTICASAIIVATTALAATPALAATTPNLTTATNYLTTTTGANGLSGGTSLGADGYYDQGTDPNTADFGLTIDGAYALAAVDTAGANATLVKVANFIESGTDGAGRTVRSWTDTDTAADAPYVQSGAIGKEALLAEVVGDNPRAFGGQNLIALLDSEVCTSTSASGTYPVCGGKGNYENATSTFDQALGIMAQLRVGDTSGAASPTAYLESQQESTGAWPQLTPSTGSPDPDSTAMAAMALATASGTTAATDVKKAVSWLAGDQGSDGSWGESTNSTALALMGLHLDGSTYSSQISKGLSFLAAEQNSDGGFDIDKGGATSDVRASTQVVSGIVGTSFATLSDPVFTSSTSTGGR